MAETETTEANGTTVGPAVEPRLKTPIPVENEEFKDRLLRLRIEKGLTQKEFADKVGTSNQYFGKWERGEFMPTKKFLVRIAEVLQVQVGYLLNGGRRLSMVVKHRKDELTEAVKESSDERFRRGLKKIGLSQEQVDAAVGVKDFKGENLLDLINLMGGYTDELAIGLMGEIKTLNAQIRDPATPPDVAEALVKKRYYLHLDIVSFTKLHQTGLITSARVQRLWQEIRQNEKEQDKGPRAVFDIDQPPSE